MAIIQPSVARHELRWVNTQRESPTLKELNQTDDDLQKIYRWILAKLVVHTSRVRVVNFMRSTSSQVMVNLAIKAAKFIAVFLLCTIIATLGWEVLLKNHVYNCTDDLPLDYLQPGQWVHHPVTVAHVSAGRTMSEPDVIKQGWTVTGLWCLWFSVVGVSLIVSAFATRLPWVRRTGSMHFSARV